MAWRPLSWAAPRGERRISGPIDRSNKSPDTPSKTSERSWCRTKETHIVFLGETKELPDLRCPLRSQSLGVHDVGEARDVLIALLDDAQGQDADVHADDAAAHALPLAFAIATRPIARMALAEQEPHPRRVQHALLHREPLLVVAAGDAEHVALELVAHAVARHLGAHATVHEDSQLAVVIDLDQLLGPVRRVGDVQLHRD